MSGVGSGRPVIQIRPASRPARRPLIGCILLAGLAVGLAAVQADTPDDLSTLWLLLAVGVMFVAVAHSLPGWGGWSAASDGLCADSRPDPAAWRSARRPGLLLLGTGLVMEVGALGLFWLDRGLSIAWTLHVGAAVLAACGLWQAAEPAERRLLPGWCRLDTLCLGVLVLAALTVRLWQLGVVPEGLWFDESQRGLEALRMLAERGYRPIFAAGILQEPTGLWYLMMPLIAVLGRDALALRLPVALAGAVGVGAVYLLGWALFGRRVAIVAAGLMVALAWHLNFSRIALPAVVSLTWDTLAAALFMVGLRRSNRLLLGLAGLACGAGLYFYFTSQLMPFVLALAAGHQLVARRFRLSRRLLVGLALCGLGFLLATGPFVFYALTRPEQFLARADAVSVMRDIQNAHSLEPLFANIRAHLLMFQVHGDNNGRHNWAGHPMLDPVTGGLSILGLGLALARVWRLESALVLGWIPIALAGGILSSIWDAPQSHRSIDALVPAVILAALPLGLLWRAYDAGAPIPSPFPSQGTAGQALPSPLSLGRERGWGWGLLRVTTTVVITILLITAGLNLDRYFRLQQADAKTWAEFMAPQTAAGRQVAALPADVPVLLEPNWVDYPSVRYLDSQAHTYIPFDPASSLPVMSERSAILIGERPGIAARIAEIYPGAIRTFTNYPGTDQAAGYGFILSPDVVRSTRGVIGRYEGSGGVSEHREASLTHAFPSDSPMPAPFSATWTASLSVPAFGTYRLRLDGPSSLVLTLDGLEAARGGTESAFRLARGLHALRLTGTDLGRQPIGLLWAAPNEELRPIPDAALNSRPVETVGLLGRVYRGTEPTGDPVVEQVDPNVELRVHLLPAPRPYTLEWSGALRTDCAGRYRFSLTGLGASTIWLDGKEVARKPVDDGTADGDLELSEGWHDIKIRFVDTTDFTYILAYWQPPGGARTLIPASALRPWPASRVPAARPEEAELP